MIRKFASCLCPYCNADLCASFPFLCVGASVQDFMQVLSMFAGFGFDWPPTIKGIFNVFSLVNFNFELLAPECSVSLNFEAKW